MADGAGRQDTNRDLREEGAVAEHTGPVPAWVSGERTAALSISRAVYSQRAVLAAAYKLSDRCIVLVDADGADRWIVYIVAPIGGDPKALLSILMREIGDQGLRDELEEKFGVVRTLIVAQAFSEGNLLDPARDDADDRVDPRGTGERR
jgi:His-Xaa-Ser system protein HxsD